MALTLYVDTARWTEMVDAAWRSFPDLVPVVKGNGYGFGRAWLTNEAIQRGAREVAVGTVFELAQGASQPISPIVLTPSLDLVGMAIPSHVVLTVASMPQVEVLLRSRPRGPVSVKVVTQVRRHGFEPHEVGPALERREAAGALLHSISIQPGLATKPAERLQEVESLLGACPPAVPLSVSHLDAEHYQRLRSEHPDRQFRIRLGTALWHGDKSALALRATVLEVRHVDPPTTAGYRSSPVRSPGSIVVVDAGTAHGVAPLANGDSPFHFARRRVTLLEPPHMHVSMLFVPEGEPCPTPGDEVDVQRPLVSSTPDRVLWR
jgi:alanine racemase